MIYLSGRLRPAEIGERNDLGLLATFPKAPFGVDHLEKTLFGIDNGCFNNPELDTKEYLKFVQSFDKWKENCLFAAAPDVVGNAKETWNRSKDVLPELRKLGFPAALVVQDGFNDFFVDWSAFDALFIGGSTAFKLSSNVHEIIKIGVEQGKWIHMGRVNSQRRLLLARFYGVHSADGTFLAFAPDKNKPKLEKWLDFLKYQPTLNF